MVGKSHRVMGFASKVDIEERYVIGRHVVSSLRFCHPRKLNVRYPAAVNRIQ
jgi:hypothetical protein